MVGSSAIANDSHDQSSFKSENKSESVKEGVKRLRSIHSSFKRQG